MVILKNIFVCKRCSERPHARCAQEYNILRDISFSVFPGEVVGIIGRNGAGKSTLLRCIKGTVRPCSGNLKVSGKTSLISSHSGVLDLNRTLIENLNIIIWMHNLSFVGGKQFKDLVLSHIPFETGTKVLGAFSRGQIAYAGFLIQLFLDHEILMIDEALVAGDFKIQEVSLELLKGTIASAKTCFLVSHSLDQLKLFCSRGIVLADGRLAYDGSIANSIHHYLTAE